MNRILHILLLSFFCLTLASAQQPTRTPDAPPAQQPGQGNPSFEKFLEEKTNFIIAEMRLPESSAAKFREIYGQMQKEKGEIMRRNEAVHKVMFKQRKCEQISDQEYLDAVRAMAKRDLEDAQLEERYLQKFESILTPQQLFCYLMAEKRFQSQFMERRGNGRGPGDRRGGPRGERQ